MPSLLRTQRENALKIFERGRLVPEFIGFRCGGLFTARGVSLKVIQQYLGHSSLQTTMIYLHLTETAEAQARDAIERIFRRP